MSMLTMANGMSLLLGVSYVLTLAGGVNWLFPASKLLNDDDTEIVIPDLLEAGGTMLQVVVYLSAGASCVLLLLLALMGYWVRPQPTVALPPPAGTTAPQCSYLSVASAASLMYIIALVSAFNWMAVGIGNVVRGDDGADVPDLFDELGFSNMASDVVYIAVGSSATVLTAAALRGYWVRKGDPLISCEFA